METIKPHEKDLSRCTNEKCSGYMKPNLGLGLVNAAREKPKRLCCDCGEESLEFEGDPPKGSPREKLMKLLRSKKR